MGKLLDLGIRSPLLISNSNSHRIDMIHIQGSNVVHCEDRLFLGSHVILSVKIYIRPSAFQKHEVPAEIDEQERSVWQEGRETAAEKMLRDRMASLLEMFKILGVVPRKRSALDAKAVDAGIVQKLADGEPVGGDDAEEEEELNDNQLDLIYQKCILHAGLSPSSDIFLLEHSKMTVNCLRLIRRRLSSCNCEGIKNRL
jgi:hypothetical protein